MNTTFYVTAETSAAPIIGKYTAFDLDIVKISVNELLQQPARKQTSIPSQGQSPQDTQIPNTRHPTSAPTRDQSKPRTTIPARHHSYSIMSQQLTPLSKATNYVKHLHQQQQHSPKGIVQKIVEKHPKVFEGIGKHKYHQVDLIIDEPVTPKVQVQRRIPFPKRQQFDEIIQELEDADIIEPVEGPTEWISNVVLTPKTDPSQLRMNIDMTTANAAIKRTRHVIPTLEELRYKFNGATHFTKLDMKQGYMQLELNPKSRYITTFYTHRELRRFKRLNFGTNSAAELFHEKISQLIVDIHNADNLYTL